MSGGADLSPFLPPTLTPTRSHTRGQTHVHATPTPVCTPALNELSNFWHSLDGALEAVQLFRVGNMPGGCAPDRVTFRVLANAFADSNAMLDALKEIEAHSCVFFSSQILMKRFNIIEELILPSPFFIWLDLM